jgi:hypothetical protein
VMSTTFLTCFSALRLPASNAITRDRPHIVGAVDPVLPSIHHRSPETFTRPLRSIMAMTPSRSLYPRFRRHDPDHLDLDGHAPLIIGTLLQVRR